MKAIEELREEIDQLTSEVSEKNSQIRALEKEIRVRSEEEIKRYFHKYIKYKYRNTREGGYESYLFVTTAEEDCCGDGWLLAGFGFTTYINEQTGKRTFETIYPNYGGFLQLNDVTKDGYYVVEFISKEDFYNARNKILQELMSETYE